MALRLWRLTQVLLAVEFVLLLGVFASCQGGPGGPAPTVSQEGPKPIPPGLVLEHAGAGGEVAGQGTFGFFKFTLDPVSHRATLEPIARAAGALGDPYNVDITGFLAGSPCTDCFRVDGVGLTPDMYPYVDFSLRHPFPLPRNNPAGPNDRLDLAVYDVKGIFLKPDPTDARYMGHFVGIAGPPQQPSTLTVDNSGFLAGITLDGITDAFDPYTDGFYPTTASAHPYILMHEDTRATTFDAGHPNGWPDHRDPIGHNVFPQGGGPFIRRVVFTAQPGDVVEYLVVLTANFASASTGKGNALGQRANPITYLPWANSKAPWRVKVTPQTNGLQEGDPNSRSTLQVDVFDWQHHLLDLTVVPSFRVENQARNSLLRPSKVTGVRAAVPGVADEDEIQVLATGGSGTPQDPLTYLLQIYNRQDADAGTYLGAIRVEDEYEPGPTAEGVGRGLTPFYLRDSSTYLTFSVEVEPAAEDPVELGSSGSSVYNGEGPAGAEESIVFDARSAGNLAAARQLSPERPFVVCEVKGTPGADGADIVLCTSPDGGNSFSVPRRVTAGTHAAGDQTAPDVAVTPDGLTVHVTYQHTGADGVSRVYYARSADQGLTFPVVLEVNPSAPGQQFNPSISVAGDNPNLVVVAYEQKYPSSSAIGVSVSTNGGFVFGDHRTFDQSSTVDVTGRRLNPMVACALPGLGEPLSVAVVWEKRNPTGPDIWATWSSAGPSGFSTPKPVSNEATTLTATNPSLMLVPGEDGADVLVAYHEQMRTLMNVGNTPVSVVTSSRAMVAIKRAVTSTFETPKQISRTSDVTYAGMPSLGYIDGTIPKLVVVWDDNRHRFTSGTDIFCAISSNRGNSWGQDFVLVGDGGTQRLPAAYVNPAGKLRLAYRDETRPVRDGIQFRRVN